jgi:uncharacterized protein (UPF0210 family)
MVVWGIKLFTFVCSPGLRVIGLANRDSRALLERLLSAWLQLGYIANKATPTPGQGVL